MTYTIHSYIDTYIGLLLYRLHMQCLSSFFMDCAMFGLFVFQTFSPEPLWWTSPALEYFLDWTGTWRDLHTLLDYGIYILPFSHIFYQAAYFRVTKKFSFCFWDCVFSTFSLCGDVQEWLYMHLHFLVCIYICIRMLSWISYLYRYIYESFMYY